MLPYNSNGIAKISYKLAHLCPNPSIKLTTFYPSQSGHKNLVYSRKKTCIFRSSLLRNGKFLLGNPEFPIKCFTYRHQKVSFFLAENSVFLKLKSMLQKRYYIYNNLRASSLLKIWALERICIFVKFYSQMNIYQNKFVLDSLE